MRKKKFTALAVCLCMVFGLAAIALATHGPVAMAKAEPTEELILSQKVITGAVDQGEVLLSAVQKEGTFNGAVVQRKDGQIEVVMQAIESMKVVTSKAAGSDGFSPTVLVAAKERIHYLTISESTGGMGGLISKMTLTTHRQGGATIVAENVDMKSRNRGYAETLMGGMRGYQVLIC